MSCTRMHGGACSPACPLKGVCSRGNAELAARYAEGLADIGREEVSDGRDA